jgi:hypoxanthine phosphoribosyltransferase
MNKDIQSILVSEDQINSISKKLGQKITTDYKTKNPIMVGLLKGCVPFMGKLMGYIETELETEYMDVSSYHGGIKSSGDVKILKDLDVPVEGRHIIIAEDIVDTGRTLSVIVDLLKYRGAKSVEVVTLLDKPDGRVVPFKPKYIGITIPNEFVVGFGLDYNEYYRNLPYVGILKKEIYKA